MKFGGKNLTQVFILTQFNLRKLNQRISASVQGTPRRGNEHIAQGDALGYVLVAPSGRALNACAYSLIQLAKVEFG